MFESDLILFIPTERKYIINEDNIRLCKRKKYILFDNWLFKLIDIYILYLGILKIVK